jgi:predicted transcriptional regulator
MKKFLLVATLILLGAAYVAGYWPEHEKLIAAQESAAQVQQQLATAQAVARICKLENDLLALIGQTENQNYGEARNLSKAFFDNLRQEVDRDQNATYKQDLENILSGRDAVTAGLARADASTAATLRQYLAQMQQLLQKLASQANL